MSRFEKSFVNRRGERPFQRLLDRIDRAGGLHVPPNSTILELGTGNGNLSVLLFQRYHPARILATDYDPEQVAVARQSLTRKFGGIPSAFTIETADASRLQYPDRSFDLVTAHLMLHHVGPVSEEQRAIGEITRVLRPGGLFLYVEMIRKKLVREELARIGYRVLFYNRSFRFFGSSDNVVAEAPSASHP
jgi:ubiquinone/menaquinone biosynthesis C-methylase UbiE